MTGSMEQIVEQSLLFDFYGELLTAHQKEIYEAAVFQDMSLGEIATEQGISRQGVHDQLKRCHKILEGYESKLHLLERFLQMKQNTEKIAQIAFDTREIVSKESMVYQNLEQIEKLSASILEEL